MEQYFSYPTDTKGNPVEYDNYGYPYSIDKETGEIIDLGIAYLRPGDSVRSKESREAYRKIREEEQKRELIYKANRNKPKFVFINSAATFDELKPQTAVRLIVLCTYAAHNSDRLMLNTRIAMKRSHLKDVLKITEGAVSKFMGEVSPKYIVEVDGCLRLTDHATCIRGNLRSQNGDIWLKVYEGIRRLYQITDKSNHKHLGYVFQLLPYINLEHNILCRNVREKDIHNIEPLTLAEFCDLIGYDRGNLTRLLLMYRKIKWNHAGRDEYFVMFVNDGVDVSRSRIIINPNILYSGSNPDGVANFAVLAQNGENAA